MPKNVLIDTIPFAYRLVESSQGSGPLRVKGIFQRADVENLNGRKYPKGLWEKVLSSKDIRESVKARSMIGEVDHPSAGEMKLRQASHVITNLEMQPDGTVLGEAEILDTEAGRHLRKLFEANIRVGISSRGSGSTMEESGTEIVQEDFRLDTFDFVATPSTPGAYPNIVNESNKQQGKTKMSVEQRFRGLREQAQKVLSQKVSLLTLNDRVRLVREAEELTINLSRLINEDAGYASLATEMIDKLAKKRESLSSPSAPPPVDKQVIAAGLVISEMTRQLKEMQRGNVSKLREMAKAIGEFSKKKVVSAKKYEAIKKKLDAASALGEAAIRRLKKTKVTEHVAGVLRDPKNANLRTMKETLEKCESVKDVDMLVVKLAKINNKGINESSLPRPGSTGTPARIVENKDRSKAIHFESVNKLKKQLGLKY